MRRTILAALLAATGVRRNRRPNTKEQLLVPPTDARIT